jgi:hypothetical protein
VRGEPRADIAVLHLCRCGRFLSRWSGLRSLLGRGGAEQHPKAEDAPRDATQKEGPRAQGAE